MCHQFEKMMPEQLLKLRGLATRQVRHLLLFHSERFNGWATHIRRSSWSTSGIFWREAVVAATLREQLCSARQKSLRTEVRNATASGFVATIETDHAILMSTQSGAKPSITPDTSSTALEW